MENLLKTENLVLRELPRLRESIRLVNKLSKFRSHFIAFTLLCVILMVFTILAPVNTLFTSVVRAIAILAYFVCGCLSVFNLVRLQNVRAELRRTFGEEI